MSPFTKAANEIWNNMNFREQWNYLLPDYKYGDKNKLDFEHLTELPPSTNKRVEAANNTKVWIENKYKNTATATAAASYDSESSGGYYESSGEESGPKISRNQVVDPRMNRYKTVAGALICCPFDLGFHAFGRVARSDECCHCPCSWMMRNWREQFGFLDTVCSDRDSSCKKNSFTPKGLVDHLEQVSASNANSDEEKGLREVHEVVLQFVYNLYQNYYPGNIHHKALYNVNTTDFRRAEAAEHEQRYRMNEQKIQHALEEGKKHRRDYTEKLEKKYRQQIQVMNALGIDATALMTKKDSVTDYEMDRYKSLYDELKEKWYYNFFGKKRNKKRNYNRITFEIDMGEQFNITEFFNEQYQNQWNSYLFKEDLNDSDYGKFMIPMEVRYISESIQELKRRKYNEDDEEEEEHEAIDEGGPAKHFFSDIWKQIADLSITVEIGSQRKKLKLFESNENFLLPLPTDVLELYLSDDQDAWDKAKKYYTAVGRLLAYCLGPNLSLKEDKEKNLVATGNQVLIADHVMPNFYKNYLLRGRKACMEEDYKLQDLVEHTFEVISCNQNDTGDDDKVKGRTMLNKIKRFLEGRDSNAISEGKSISENFRTAVDNFFIEERSIAIEAIKDGMTLGGQIDPTGLFSIVPLDAVRKFAFAKVDVTADDIIRCIKPVYEERVDDPVHRFYQSEVVNLNEDGDGKPTGHLFDLLRDSSDEFRKNFLFYATGCHYIPQSNFEIKIEFNMDDTIEGNLPRAHTCTNELVFPSDAYEGNKMILEEKLTLAFQLMCDNPFGMG